MFIYLFIYFSVLLENDNAKCMNSFEHFFWPTLVYLIFEFNHFETYKKKSQKLGSSRKAISQLCQVAKMSSHT